MKTLTLMALAALVALAPIEIVAQTGCPIGSTQDSIVYTQTITNITAQNTVVSFPQAATGISTFSGVTLRVWVNTSQSFLLVNRELVDVADYTVDVDRQTKVTGNGLNSPVVDSLKSYGPYMLNAFGAEGSSMTVGPDSPFRQTLLIASTANVVPFTGTGTVSVTYNNKGLIGVNGSDNYSVQVNSNTSATFEITYYFCTASNLPTLFDDLQVRKEGANAILNWGTRSESEGMAYRVEASEDGDHFRSLGIVEGKGMNLSKYEFVEPLTTDAGKRYYRIAILYPEGNTALSMIRTLAWGIPTSAMGVYPNPAGRQFTVRFGQPMTSSTRLQLISMTGQILETHAVSVDKSSSVNVTLDRTYPSGAYIIKAISPDGRSGGLCRILLAD